MGFVEVVHAGQTGLLSSLPPPFIHHICQWLGYVAGDILDMQLSKHLMPTDFHNFVLTSKRSATLVNCDQKAGTIHDCLPIFINCDVGDCDFSPVLGMCNDKPGL